jgi:hypothetical protein
MRHFYFVASSLLAILLLAGCEQKPSTQELGTVLDGIPQVKGADRPFEMPLLGPPPPEDSLPRGRHHP